MLTADAAHELALLVGLEWTESDRDVLQPLVEMAIVWVDDDRLARAAAPIVAVLWQDGLCGDIDRALEESAKRFEEVARRLPAARADLAAGPRRSLLANAVVRQGAHELADAELLPVHCLLCLEEGLQALPPPERGSLAAQAARIASRAACVPEGELRSAMAAAAASRPGGDAAIARATDERRRAVRAWLGRIAELGVSSLPILSAELGVLLAGPLPTAADDALWRETVRGLVGGLGAEWN